MEAVVLPLPPQLYQSAARTSPPAEDERAPGRLNSDQIQFARSASRRFRHAMRWAADVMRLSIGMTWVHLGRQQPRLVKQKANLPETP